MPAPHPYRRHEHRYPRAPADSSLLRRRCRRPLLHHVGAVASRHRDRWRRRGALQSLSRGSRFPRAGWRHPRRQRNRIASTTADRGDTSRAAQRAGRTGRRLECHRVHRQFPVHHGQHDCAAAGHGARWFERKNRGSRERIGWRAGEGRRHGDANVRRSDAGVVGGLLRGCVGQHD